MNETTSRLETARKLLGFERFSEPQQTAFDYWTEGVYNDLPNPDRMCVYYPTGTGKTEIMLVSMFLRGVEKVLVVAPPSTHARWQRDAAKLELEATVISHRKFLMDRGKKFSHSTGIIVDEFHMLGGHRGIGWKRLDAAARGLKAPIVIGSATPNYNDAERVYCVAHVIDPGNHKGGYLTWLYEHCLTENNPYGAEPIVTGFREYTDAEDFLARLPGVVYLEDTAPDILRDVDISTELPQEFDEYNLDLSTGLLMASQMEKKHRERYLQIVDEDVLHPHVTDQLVALYDTGEPVLIFAMHATVAEKCYDTLKVSEPGIALVTGKTPGKEKERLIQQFRDGEVQVLIGTATLATGTDGIDKVCDTMVILDDTEDDAQRRQLVGRILPRGIEDVDASHKVAHRFVYHR